MHNFLLDLGDGTHTKESTEKRKAEANGECVSIDRYVSCPGKKKREMEKCKQICSNLAKGLFLKNLWK